MRGRAGWGLLALPALPADLCHMTAVTTDRFAPLLACPPGFGRRKLVRGPPLVRGPAPLGSNLALTLLAHTGKAAAPTRRAPRCRGAPAKTRLSRLPRPRAGALRPRLGRPRLARARPLRPGLALFAPDLVHRSRRDFFGTATIPSRLLCALFNVFVLSLSLLTGTAWHLTSSLPERYTPRILLVSST